MMGQEQTESQIKSHQQEGQLSIPEDDELSEEELAHVSSSWPVFNMYYSIYSHPSQVLRLPSTIQAD